MKTGSRYVAFGTRSLSVATGLDHTTVAAHLRALREEDDPLIDLIENDRGLPATCTSCGSPTRSPPGPAGSPGRPGSCTRCGRCSGNSATPPRSSTKPSNTTEGRPERSFDLVTGTGLSRTAVYEALETLAAWNLAEQRDGRWSRITGTSRLDRAEQLKMHDALVGRAHIGSHRAERWSLPPGAAHRRPTNRNRLAR